VLSELEQFVCPLAPTSVHDQVDLVCSYILCTAEVGTVPTVGKWVDLGTAVGDDKLSIETGLDQTILPDFLPLQAHEPHSPFQWNSFQNDFVGGR
jgi:hypothetical protein